MVIWRINLYKEFICWFYLTNMFSFVLRYVVSLQSVTEFLTIIERTMLIIQRMILHRYKFCTHWDFQYYNNSVLMMFSQLLFYQFLFFFSHWFFIFVYQLFCKMNHLIGTGVCVCVCVAYKYYYENIVQVKKKKKLIG